MPEVGCPSQEQLSAYLLGVLAEDDAGWVARHVEHCANCDTTMDDLEDRSDRLIDQLRQPASPDRYSQEPECREAISLVGDVNGNSRGSTDTLASDTINEETDLGRLGDYELIEELDHGGMGTVFRAMHVKLGRQVALKVLPKGRMTDERAVARFEREMMAVGRLDHPNIVRATDASEAEGVQFLAMELIEGFDLGQLVELCGPLRLADSCDLMLQAAMGLQCAHEAGLVHRDIKPSNLMVTFDGVLKVLDLGLARFQLDQPAGREITAVGQPMGTADYMAPEQVRDTHSVDIRADIYSLGCTFYKLLTGQPPFGGEEYQTSIDKMMAHRKDSPPPIQLFRAELPNKLVRILDRMLDKDPDNRFTTPLELGEALAPLTAESDLIAMLKKAEEANQAQEAERATAAEARRDDDATGEQGDGAASGSRATNSQKTGSRSTGSRATATGSRGSGEGSGSRGTGSGSRGTGSSFRGTGTRVGRSSASKTMTGVQPSMGVFVEMDRARRRKRLLVGVGIMVVLSLLSIGLFTWTFLANLRLERDTASWNVATRATYWVSQTIPPPIARAKPVSIAIPGDCLIETGPGLALSREAVVAQPSPIEGVVSWTIETRAHRSPIQSIALSPDGRQAATGSLEGVIRLWNLADASLLGMLVGYDGAIRALSWSPDGRYLAAGYSSAVVRIWEVAHGRLLRSLPARVAGSNSLGWSPDGQWLAYVAPAADEAGDTIHLWETETGRVRHTLTCYESNVRALAFSPDGKRLATGGRLLIKLWDVASGQSVRDLKISSKAHADNVSALAWSPAATMIASATSAPSGDHSVAFWDVETGRSLGRLRPHLYGDRSLIWTSDGKVLISAGAHQDGKVRFWDFGTADFLPMEFDGGSGLLAAAASGDSMVAVQPGGVLQLFDLELNGEVRTLGEHTGVPTRVAFSPDAELLACGQDNRTVRFWMVQSGQLLRELEVPGRVQSIQWAADGKRMAAISDSPGGSIKRTVRSADIFSTESGEKLFSLAVRGRQRIVQLAFSPDGQTIASVGDEWRIWEAAGEDAGSLRRSYLPGATTLSWSSDATALAVGSEAGVTICDVNSGAQLHEIPCPEPSVLLMSDDAKMLAAADGDDDTSVLLLDVDSEETLHELRGSHRSSIVAMAWRTEGEKRVLVSASSTEVCRWDAESGNLLGTKPIPVTALSPEARLIATVGPSMIRLHRLDDEQLLGTILSLEARQHAVVGPGGHWRGSRKLAAELVYVVQSSEGQETLTQTEFAEKYNWQNDPKRVQSDRRK